MALAGDLGMKLDLERGCQAAGLRRCPDSVQRVKHAIPDRSDPRFRRPLQALFEKARSRCAVWVQSNRRPPCQFNEVATPIMEVDIAEAKAAWQKPLDW